MLKATTSIINASQIATPITFAGDVTLSTGNLVFGTSGAAGTPVITTSGDPNTGIFFPAADTIAFSEGGAEAMRIDSSGNLLIGTTATTGNANNTKLIVGGTFSTVSGSVSAANATATTLFTAPSTVAAWLVTVNISAAAASLYAATYLVNTQGGSSTVATLIFKGTNILITMSGYAVQVTQTSGVTQTVTYSALRIA